MRILHIINALGLGGAETLLYRLAMRDSDNEHMIVSLGAPGWYSRGLQERGVPLHHLGMTSALSIPAGVLRLHRIIRESGADVVQCWMYRSNVLGGVVAKVAHKPVVWGIHCSSLSPLKPSSRALARLSGVLARWTPDVIINCSTRSAEIHDKIGYAAARSVVIHNGYDEDRFLPDEQARRTSRQALGVDTGEFVVGSIARWHKQKDIPNFLAAVRIARDRGVPLRGWLVGAGLGPENQQLVSLIEQSGCTEFVAALGPRADVHDIARALDLHALASCGGEAFPNVVAETMLSGTPNVVTDVGDMAFMVGKNGWIVRPGSPEQLANAIVAAYREREDAPGSWKRRRSAARRQIAKRFSIDGMAQGYENVWRDVAAPEISH